MRDLLVDFITSLDGYPDVALELIDSRTFDGRIQLVEYRPRVVEHHRSAQPDDARSQPRAARSPMRRSSARPTERRLQCPR